MITSMLEWLAGSAAVPRWVVTVGACCTICVVSAVLFLVWFGWLTGRLEAQDEHD